MREIEFRIRDRDKWYYGVPLSKIKNDTVAFQSYDGNYYDLFADATTLGQCTEQKDKNGKKIFEGDIITCINTTRQGYNIGQKMCGFIEYEEYGCYWFCKNNFQHYNDWVYADDIEVIGNIHDNPDLLK